MRNKQTAHIQGHHHIVLNEKCMKRYIYMRSSNCWHWKLWSYDLYGSSCVPLCPSKSWLAALPVPVRLQPLPVNDWICVSLFVSRILSFVMKRQSNAHAHVHEHTNHLRIFVEFTNSHNNKFRYQMTSTTFKFECIVCHIHIDVRTPRARARTHTID